MTERELSIATQIATPIQPSYTPTASVAPNDAIHVNESVDEEPYTIKCICDYSDDDGNTIYCEKCDTWQHIECFYPGRVEDASREDFDHSCADCKPRTLDRRHATERQRQNKSSSDSAEKKAKRPPSKSHKKKPKPSDLQLNGYHDQDNHTNGNAQDHQPHTKKGKGHRANRSINSVKRSPPHNARSHHPAHPPSPAHTPPDLPNNFHVHSYSDNFLALFNDDDGARQSQNNSFASLPVTNAMSLWLHDPRKLEQDTGVKDKTDIFQNLIIGVDQLSWPDLRVEHRDATINDTHLHWRYLITATPLSPPNRIGELNGVVGFQKDYCSDIENRWHELTHPRPFIFFHPRLPLFIDTRQEGSICRYVRRSCRANTVLETFIADRSEYHFWLISEQPLKANEQITIAWDFRFPAQVRSRFLHLVNLGDEDGAPVDDSEITDEEYQQLTNVIQLVLSDYGGCACDLGNDCAFARFHRNYHGKVHSHSNGTKAKKGRKPKQHVSPTSTGHATNSRAVSEQQEAYDEDDNRSVSGEVKSKPQSRDMTPGQGSVEANGILTETTDREKRKLAALEDTFRKMEQGQPPRKKKRASDGNSPVPGPAAQQLSRTRQKSVAARVSVAHPSGPNVNGRSRNYVDASTSRRQSGSPFAATSPTDRPSPQNLAMRRGSQPISSRRASLAPKNRSNYVDATTQTDNVDNEWYSRSSDSLKRKKSIISLSQRLLKNRLKIQKSSESIKQGTVTNVPESQSALTSPTAPMDVDRPSPEEQRNTNSPVEMQAPNNIASDVWPIEVTDVTMPDAPALLIIGRANKPPPPSWPGQSPTKASDLRVQMPPTPTFSVPNLSGALASAGSATPSSATGLVAPSPLGTTQPAVFSPTVPLITNGVGPSPVKKKISLSDYKARLKRNDTAHAANAAKTSTGSSPTAAPAVLKPLPTDQVKAAGVLGSTIIESPETETTDPMSAADAPVINTKNSLPVEKTNGIL